jgi:hypothetical protein
LIPYVAPKRDLKAFNCPHCNAYADQRWERVGYTSIPHFSVRGTEDLGLAFCTHCKKFTLWLKENMVLPLVGGAPIPHRDLPPDVKEIYEEARSIVSRSPRSSAALLRLSIEMLTDRILQQDSKGRNLFSKIGLLVEQGLPDKIQKSLDILRVIGNHSVHPGQINITDDYGTALNLFKYINMIADYMIRQPKELDEAYKNLPEKDLKSIKKRDSKSKRRKSTSNPGPAC